MVSWLLQLIEVIPHFSFGFKSIPADFSLDWRSEYAQSLALIAAAIGVVALLLLLTISITWICQCCAKEDTSGKSRRQVLRLSRILFVLSLFCFILLGVCLVANEVINRGVLDSINGIKDVNDAFKSAVNETHHLNDTCQNGTVHVQQLEELVHTKSKEPGVNQTLVGEVDVLLTNITNRLDTVTEILRGMEKVLSEVSFMEKVEISAIAYERERWLTVMILLIIMIGVFFAGLLSFCRRSKSIAVGFSGAGMVIFIVTWLLLCIITASTVALTDFCTRGDKYISQHISKPMIDTMVFYNSCTDGQSGQHYFPSAFEADNISSLLTDIQQTKTKLDFLLDQTFNHSEIVANTSAVFNTDASTSMMKLGNLQSAVTCSKFSKDVRAMHSGLCDQSVLGSFILTICLFFLGVLLFVVLLTVSKSWKLFSRFLPTEPCSRVKPQLNGSLTNHSRLRPSDYVEVDEDDPFFPRGTDSNIPVDIYGTHMFNPRTRDRAEPSTNTTIVTANGMGADETRTPLWSGAQPQQSSSNYADHPYGNFHQTRYDDV